MVKVFRVDDRLIHGQVQTAWIKEYQINRIIIIDDDVVNDEVQKAVLKFAKPPQAQLVICGTDRALDLLAKDATQQNARTLVIFKTIVTAAALVKKGLKITNLVIGPTSSKEGATHIAKTTYFDDLELKAAKELINNNVNVAVQFLPGDAPQSLVGILKKA